MHTHACKQCHGKGYVLLPSGGIERCDSCGGFGFRYSVQMQFCRNCQTRHEKGACTFSKYKEA